MCAVSILSFVALALLVTSGQAKDRCHLRELDLCLAVGAGNNKISTTEADVDKQCKVIEEVSECIGNYTKICATAIQRELVSFVTGGAREVQQKYCTRGEKLRNDYLKHAPCLAKAQSQGQTCLNDVKTGLQSIEDAQFSERTTAVCCVYSRYSSCASRAVEGACGKEAVEYGNIFRKLALTNIPELLCQSFDNNPVCDTLLPPSGTKPKSTSKSIVSRLFNAYLM